MQRHMEWPEVSVVLSTFNRPERLVVAVEAILRQDFDGQYEVIVIDDGSATAREALEPLRSLADERGIRLVVGEMEENSGYQSRPKNQGLLVSRGAYIAWADDDDIWLPHHLSTLVGLLRAGECDGAYGSWVNRNEGGPGPKDGTAWEYIPFNWLTAHLILTRPQLNFISCHTVVSKAAIVSNQGAAPWNENIRRFGDWELWRRLIAGGFRWKGTPVVTYQYVWHRENLQLTRKPNEVTAAAVRPEMAGV